MSGELLTIGEISERCKVSKDRLRHYDKKGILKPAYVDEETKRRYYTKE